MKTTISFISPEVWEAVLQRFRNQLTDETGRVIRETMALARSDAPPVSARTTRRLRPKVRKRRQPDRLDRELLRAMEGTGLRRVTDFNHNLSNAGDFEDDDPIIRNRREK